MTDPEVRPEPLRVPVVDVATRNSLVGPTPKPQPPVQVAGAVVLQRAVRIVSDYPAPRAPSGPPAHLYEAQAHRQRVSSAPPASQTPTVKTASVPPPPPVEGASHASHSHESTLNQAYASHDDASAYERDGDARAPQADAEHQNAGNYAEADAARGHADGPADADHEAQATRLAGTYAQRGAYAHSEADAYASMEIDPLDDPLELEDMPVPAADDTVDEEELDAASIEMSVPPPPPAEASVARRRAANNDVEITVSYDDDGDDDDDDGRSSGEFEELDVEAAMRNVDHDETRTPPPPPPVGRLSLEPPDLQTLTRTARVAEARPSKPRAHPWWEVFFDDDYLRTVRPPTHQQIARQCDFIAKRLHLKPGATVLDVGCGLGLQVVELASRGYLSVGLDLSLAMLSRASEEAQARGTKINFLHADMRDMNFEGNFDAVMCIGTSLGYFDDDTNKKVIERLFRALKPNGVLLLDVVNRDHVIRTQPNLIWFEGDGCVCMEESEFNFFTSRLHVKRTVILETGKQRENEYSLRLYSLHELGQLLHQFGFRVIEVSGREALPGVFFGQESPNMMVVAERRSHADSTGKYPALVD